VKIRTVVFVGAVARPGGPAPGDLPEIAFSGRSNVGKSSLINRLLGRTRTPVARVSGTPGKTREINFYRVNALAESGAPVEFHLVDLPGYGYAQRSKKERRSWGPLMEQFFRSREGLRAVVVIVDARRGAEPDDLELLQFLQHAGRHAILVATKVDKLPRSARARALQRIGTQAGLDAVPFSSVDGVGRDALWALLLAAAHLE
jgi:GTP-binding protein